MGEAQPQRVANVGEDFARSYWKKLTSKAATNDTVNQVGQPVDREDPHRKKVPLQRALCFSPDGDPLGKMQPAEKNLVIVDFEAAADHDHYGEGVYPMHDAHRQRMQPASITGP